MVCSVLFYVLCLVPSGTWGHGKGDIWDGKALQFRRKWAEFLTHLILLIAKFTPVLKVGEASVTSSLLHPKSDSI